MCLPIMDGMIKTNEPSPTVAADQQRILGHLYPATIAGILVLLYYAIFVAYLWRSQESDPLHWLSLVVAPFVLILIGTRLLVRRRLSLKNTLASVGLRKGNLRHGVLLGIVLGIAASIAQLFFSNRRHEFWQVIVSGKVLLYLPMVIVLLLLTAGFTEEFFFRGILQTRLSNWWRSDLAALLVASVLFGLYHFPYAYLNPNWSSHGHVLLALGECGMDAVAGLLLGFVYWKSGRNLLASVAMHTIFDALPAMTMIHFAIHIGG